MGNLGRNDPCPCGSGKKYKKCCLGTRRDPAAHSFSEAPAPPESPGAYVYGLRRIITEILEAANRVLRGDEGACLRSLTSRLMLHSAEGCSRKASAVLDLYCALGSEILAPNQTGLRDAVFHHLPSDESRAMYSQLITTPLRVWEVRTNWLERAGAKTVFGPGKDRKEDLATILTLGRLKAEDRLVGWVLTHKQRRLLLGIWDLSLVGLKRLRGEAQQIRETNCDEYWKALVPPLLRSIVDPTGQFRLSGSRAESISPDVSSRTSHAPTMLMQTCDTIHRTYALDLGSAWHSPIRFQMKGWEQNRIGWFREQIALAAGAEQRRDLMEMVRLGLEHKLRRMLPNIRPADLATWIVLQEAIAPFGLREDGALAHLDEDALPRRPASLLFLPDDHPLWADLHPSVPIQSALAWAGIRGGTNTAAQVQKSYEKYLAEERWLATNQPIAIGKPSPVIAVGYEETRHALTGVFDRAAADAQLSALEIDEGSLKRLGGAIEQIMKAPQPDAGWQVRDLPQQSWTLLNASGYGHGTHERVAAGLLAYARTWRARRAGIDPAAIERIGVSSEARVTLREGLGEIESLFELS